MPKTELEYRTFEELMDSVKIDLKQFDLEGMINDQELIKVAQRVNYELGLRINPDKSRVVSVEKGKAKLPSDFYVLNFALVCDPLEKYLQYPVQWSYKTYDQGVIDGAAEAEMIYKTKMVNSYTELTTIDPGENLINHCLGTTYVIVQAFAQDGSMLTFDVNIVDKDNLQIISELPDSILGVKVVVHGAKSSTCCPVIGSCEEKCPPKPSCEIEVDENNCAVVSGFRNGYRYEYRRLLRLSIVKNKSVSPHCVNINTRAPYAAWLKNGFIETNFEEGDIFLSYDSVMEDDEGNLLVLDHPMVNEFYEYALKQRIFENLLMAGQNVTGYLQLVEQRIRAARNNAYSFVNTPDFAELQKNWEMNRKAMYGKYYNMFKSYPAHNY